MTEHTFRFDLDDDNPVGLRFSGGPDPHDPSEWRYCTGDQITFASSTGPFIVELMLTHNPTDELIPVPAVTPFPNNQNRFESPPAPDNDLWKAGPVVVRSPQEAGIGLSGDPSRFIARYRYAVAVGFNNRFILDTSQHGEWDHC